MTPEPRELGGAQKCGAGLCAVFDVDRFYTQMAPIFHRQAEGRRDRARGELGNGPEPGTLPQVVHGHGAADSSRRCQLR